MKADTNRKTNIAAAQERKLVREYRTWVTMGATKITLFCVTKMGVGGYDVMLMGSQHIKLIHFLL